MARRSGSKALDLELQDAYWELPGADYVPAATVPTSLLEDSDRLDSSWTATVQSMKDELNEPDDIRTRIADHVEDFNARHQPATTGTDEPTGAASREATTASRPRLFPRISFRQAREGC